MNTEVLTPKRMKKIAEEALYDAARLEAQLQYETHWLARNQIKARILIRLSIVKKMTA